MIFQDVRLHAAGSVLQLVRGKDENVGNELGLCHKRSEGKQMVCLHPLDVKKTKFSRP